MEGSLSGENGNGVAPGVVDPVCEVLDRVGFEVMPVRHG